MLLSFFKTYFYACLCFASSIFSLSVNRLPSALYPDLLGSPFINTSVGLINIHVQNCGYPSFMVQCSHSYEYRFLVKGKS
jgi:hypothetical protein